MQRAGPGLCEEHGIDLRRQVRKLIEPLSLAADGMQNVMHQDRSSVVNPKIKITL